MQLYANGNGTLMVAAINSPAGSCLVLLELVTDDGMMMGWRVDGVILKEVWLMLWLWSIYYSLD